MLHNPGQSCLLVITAVLLLANAAQCVQRDPYQVLGVRRSATQKEIIKAFRTMSRQYHPDKNPSKDATGKFQDISAAYDYLTDPSRQNKPWEWDFSDGAPSGRGRKGPYSAYDAFDAFQGTYQFVLDLDPMRIIGMVRTWFDQHTQKHQTMYKALWQSSVDQAVCQALQASWKLPRLLEPPLMFLARHELVTYQAGQWRAWTSSGILLELGFWVARQTPCLQYAGSGSIKTPAPATASGQAKDAAEGTHDSSSPQSGPMADVERLVELQQQLHTHRKLREQLLQSPPAATKAQQRSKAGQPSSSSSKSRSSSGSVMLDGFTADLAQLQLLQGRLLWWALLMAGCYLMQRDRQLLLVGAGLVAAGLWSLFWGAGGSEGAVWALGAALDANSWTGWLIGAWYTATCASLCLLLPLVLASCMLLLATWLWAAVSCSSLAMTPCVSRMGASIWIALRLWNFCGGQLLQGSALAVGLCFVLYQRPSLAVWWATNLVSPVLFVWHLLWVMALSWGNWMGLTQRSPERAVRIAAALTARQAQAKLQDSQQQHTLRQRPQQLQQERGTTGAANGAASPHNKQGRTQEPSSSPDGTAAAAAAAAAADPAADFASAAAYAPRASMRRRATRATCVTVWSIFNGPWWPGAFGPLELACTCYWWVRMLGWVLPRHALTAVVIACKLSFAAAVFMMAVAALGVADVSLTVGQLVQVVLLRVGAGVGLLCVALRVLDDLARIMDPKLWAERQHLRQRQRGRLPWPWHQPLHKVQQQQQQPRQQGASDAERAASPGLIQPRL